VLGVCSVHEEQPRRPLCLLVGSPHTQDTRVAEPARRTQITIRLTPNHHHIIIIIAAFFFLFPYRGRLAVHIEGEGGPRGLDEDLHLAGFGPLDAQSLCEGVLAVGVRRRWWWLVVVAPRHALRCLGTPVPSPGRGIHTPQHEEDCKHRWHRLRRIANTINRSIDRLTQGSSRPRASPVKSGQPMRACMCVCHLHLHSPFDARDAAERANNQQRIVNNREEAFLCVCVCRGCVCGC
jgi:hypothetical protein